MNAPVEHYMLEALASIETEQAILGGLMLNNGMWDHVGDVLKPTDFFSETNQAIYAAIMVLATANKNCDVVAVFEAMKGEVELMHLSRLAQYVPAVSNMRQYANTVRERSLSRDLQAVSVTISDLAQDHATGIAERVDAATGLLAKLLPDSPRDDWEGGDTGMVEFLDGIQRRADGEEINYIPTGLRDLDRMLDGGLRGGELVIIGARPSMGKSALALTIGMTTALAGVPNGLFSMEMPKHEVRNRQVSMLSRVHLSKLKRPEHMGSHDWSAITESVEQVARAPFFVSDQSALNINQVRSKARTLKRRHGLKLLTVDYLGLMEGVDRKANRTAQLEDCTKGLKVLAKELDIPIILLAQLNREVEKRVDQMPILSDLRDCGAIEQDADIVIFLNRPIQAKPDLGEEWKHYARGSVAKQRNGSTGYFDLRYIGENTRFADWDGQRPTSGASKKGGHFE